MSKKREKEVAGFIKNILKISMAALVVPVIAVAAQQQNPRGTTNARNTATRADDSASSASIRRSATSVIARSAAKNARQSRAVVTARPASNISVRSARPVIQGGSVVRSASKPSIARSGTKQQKKNGVNLSRAGTARATAVFNDITKMGSGYSNCRDAYATCMDQFCANANDTYRRCYCSDRFKDFRDTSDSLDEALKLLADFQDNNLNAVDKTAAEVNAMYTATAGEMAIKRDTSASQKLLDSIGDVLSGKKKTDTKQTLNSLGVLDFSGFGGSDDIFGSGSSSLFGRGESTDISSLEGKELYNNVAKQCMEIAQESCGSDAMFNLAKSAYSIMITQDCNAFEKNINAKKSSVEETVRTAEKYLREARLEEYRSHNSADVNECLSKVEEAIRKPTACGPDYEKCLDYTGQYINATTGEPIFSQALFKLNSLIVLDGTDDVLGANSGFDKWLDNKKMFATAALDTCRDSADIVWYEFKRSALIQIAQAQDEKIQQIKDSCVATVKQCYDKQTGDLKSMDTTELQGTGAIATATARGMCYDRVQACAALYGDPDGCVYDDAKKKLSTKVGKCGDKDCKCGLQSLLTFVDTVDSVKVAEGCESVLKKYVAEICPVEYDEEEKDAEGNKKVKTQYGGMCLNKSKNELRAAMDNRRKIFCAEDLVDSDNSNTLQASSAFNTNIMNQIIKGIYDELNIAFTAGCEEMDPDRLEVVLDKDGKEVLDNGKKQYRNQRGGIWVNAGEMARPAPDKLYQYFYKKYYGTYIRSNKQIDDLNLEDKGWCLDKGDKDVQIIEEALKTGDTLESVIAENEGGAMCRLSGGTWKDQKCELPTSWYKDACTDVLGGTWQSGQCLVDVDPDNRKAIKSGTLSYNSDGRYTASEQAFNEDVIEVKNNSFVKDNIK